MHRQRVNRRGDRWTRVAADEKASCRWSGDRCGRKPGDTCGRQKLEGARTRSPRRAYPPTPGSQKGTCVSIVPSHPVCGSWCQPGKLVHGAGHGDVAAGELEAGLCSGCLGHTPARTHGPHSYRAQSRCERLVRSQKCSRDGSRRTSLPWGSSRPGTLTSSLGLRRSSDPPRFKGRASSACTPAPSFPPGPHLSIGNKRKEFLKFLKRGGTISIFKIPGVRRRAGC